MGLVFETGDTPVSIDLISTLGSPDVNVPAMQRKSKRGKAQDGSNPTRRLEQVVVAC